MECFENQCEGQVNLPQGRGETVCSLEEGRDEVSPVRPYDVEGVHGANKHMPSLGVIETPGSFGLTSPRCGCARVCVGTCEWCK